MKKGESYFKGQHFCVFILVLIIPAATAFGDTIHVPGEQPTIQAAIDVAVGGDEVLIHDGTYRETDTISIDKPITIQSVNGPDVTIVDGIDNSGGDVLTFTGGSEGALLMWVTITNGYSGVSFGTLSSPATVADCVITGNEDGVFGMVNSKGTVTGCLISNNAENGVVLCQSELILSDCMITGNGKDGVVDWCGYGVLNLSGCKISLNNGFGVDLGAFYGHVAATITNCVISENVSTGFRYYSDYSTGTLVNSTIVDNGAFGIHFLGDGTGSSFTVANTILRNNSDAEISADPGADAVMSITYSNVEGGWPGAGNIDCHPDFVGSNDFHLLASSCCIDAGTSNGAPGEDMDGDVRPYDGGYDIGADEYYPIHAGFVVLNQEVYGSGMNIHILVTDSDLNTDLGQAEEYSDILTITTDHDGVIYDTESTITMTETGPATGVFMGSIAVAYSSATSGNDVLEILCQTQENITATYHDTNDGSGNEAFPSDTAYTDCDSPEVSNMQVIHTEYPFATITWDTDEAADSCVYYGTTTALGLSQCQSSLVTEHTIVLSELLPGTTYYFAIGSVDEAGNETLDNNNELYHQFTTLALAVYYVPDDYPTIQNAINARVSYDEIVVRPGTYYENINFQGKEITVRSEGGPAVTVIDGGGPGSVVAFTSGEESAALLQGFTITNGDSDWEGGGIWFENFSSPTVDDCIITNNNSDLYGAGGIFCNESSPTITNCIISNNTCDFGRGGIFLTWYSSPTIANCTISSNIGTDGHGAGIYCYYYSAPTITNCIITGNRATGYGGGIYCHFCAAPTIANCTISDNFAESGGGIYCKGCSAPTIVNSIVWGNAATAGPGEIYVDSDSTIGITYSDIKGGWSGGNINSNPAFLVAGDYHLSAGSCCIDAGTSEGAPDTDFEGDARPQGVGYDIGADEYLLPLLPCEGDFDYDGDVDGSDLAVFVAGGTGITLEQFAGDFGRTVCPH